MMDDLKTTGEDPKSPLLHSLKTIFEGEAFRPLDSGDSRKSPGHSEPWATLRDQGWASFQKSGLPTRTHEEWKYTSLRALSARSLVRQKLTASPALDLERLKKSLEPHLLPEDWALVSVNGRFCPELSTPGPLPQGVTMRPITEALSLDWENLREVLAHASELEHVQDRHNPFVALHQALIRDGFVLEIAKGAQVGRPLHLVHLSVPEDPSLTEATFPWHVIKMHEGAEAQLVETFCTVEKSSFVCGMTDLWLAPSARLHHVRVSTGEAHHRLDSDLPSQRFGIFGQRARLDRDSYLSTFSLALGGTLTRVDLEITLNASGADVDLDGLYLARAGHHIDHHTAVDHRVPHATSRQLYKGVLGESGRGVFNGKIKVRPGAHGTNAFQLNQNLLLSSDAEIDTKPELAIDADDVKCSHGAAVGQIDPEQVFYLESRGLPRIEAHKILCAAFADEALAKVKDTGRFQQLKRLTMDFFRV